MEKLRGGCSLNARLMVENTIIDLHSRKAAEMTESSRDDGDDNRGQVVIMLNHQKQVEASTITTG